MKNLLVSKREKAVFLIVIVSALSVSVYAYFRSLAPSEGPRVSLTSPPLEFSLELDRTGYLLGENMTITFCMKNISNKTISVGYGYLNLMHGILTEAYGASTYFANDLTQNLHFGFSVRGENGTVVFEYLRGVLPSTYTIVLEPNGYVKQTMFWGYDVADDRPYLPKGTYQVRAVLDAGVSGLGRITLETPSITFTYN